MLSYLKLYGHFIRFSFARSSAFRFEFWTRVCMDLMYYAVGIGFYKLLFFQTTSLVGWSEAEALVFVGLYLLLDALQMVFIANNTWWFPVLVTRGDLDYYLVRPVSTLFFVSLRDIGVASIVNVIAALGIVLWALNNLSASAVPGLYTGMSLWQAIITGILLLNGVFLFYCLRWLFIMPIFWSQTGRGLDNLFWQMHVLLERPDGIYRGVFRLLLVTVVPFGLMASFPARIALDGFSWGIVAHSLGASVWMFTLLLFIWKRALRGYSSASS